MNVFIILNYNDFETTINFLKMIKDYSSISKIVVVDNNSTDGSYEKISRYKSNKIFIIKSDKNGGYGYGNNFGIKFARKKWNSIDFFTITNPDIIVSEQTIFSLNCIFNTHQELGIIAPVIRNVDNSIVSNFIWEVPSYKAMITETSLIGHKICKMINKSIYHNFN
ncbi:glycosyltransferase, partial [bacterium]|nr:glycosyltransferase [bacterium]